MRDLRERHEAERLRYMAHHDALTGLPNRTALMSRLQSLVDRGRETGARFAVLFIDLDGFKLVNDGHGHVAGDQILRDVALRLAAAMQPGEFLARAGGDEFIILQDRPHQPEASLELGERLLDLFQPTFILETGGGTSLGLSVGIAVYPLDGETQESLLRKADASLYSAKSNGGRCACVASMNSEAA